LLKEQVDRDAKTNENQTPLDLAIQRKSIECVMLFWESSEKEILL